MRKDIFPFLNCVRDYAFEFGKKGDLANIPRSIIFPHNPRFSSLFLQIRHRSKHSFIAFSTYKLIRSSYLSKIASFLLLYIRKCLYLYPDECQISS